MRDLLKKHTSVIFGTAAFMLPFLIYVCSLMPSFGFWDTGEMQTVPYIFGVAHPTGFPAFIFSAGIFAHIFPIGNVAWRVNLFSALTVAASAWVLFAALCEAKATVAVSLLSAFVFAFTQAVWHHATRADPHDLTLLFESLSFLYVIRWRGYGRARDILMASLALGLALATHPLALWSIPGLLVLALTGTRRLPARAVLPSLAAVAAPLLLYLYIPVRSAQLWAQQRDPTLALGVPPGQPYWDYAHTSGGLASLLWYYSGAQFSPNRAMSAVLSPSQVAYGIVHGGSFLIQQMSAVSVILAAIGAVVVLLSDRSLVLGALLAGALVLPFAFEYKIEADKASYFLFTIWIVAFILGLGLSKIRTAPKWAAPTILVLLATMLCWENRGLFSERLNNRAPTYVRYVLSKTPQNAIVVTPWVLATPIAYCIYVQHRCGSRILVTAKLNATSLNSIRKTNGRPIYEIRDGKPMPIVERVK